MARRMAITAGNQIIAYFPCRLYTKQIAKSYRIYIGKAGGIVQTDNETTACDLIDSIVDAYYSLGSLFDLSEFVGIEMRNRTTF